MYFTIEERIVNFKKYYSRKNSRALVGFFVGSEYPLERYPASRKLPSGRPLKPEDFNCQDFLEDCDRLFQQHEEIGGDFIWSASAFWGIPWIEAALGCEIISAPESGSIYSIAPANFAENPHIKEFDPDGPWIKKMVEFIDVLALHSHGRYPLATTRMRGIADLLAALYGNELFLYKMMEKPSEVEKICEKLTDFWVKFGKIQLDHIPLFHGGVGSFYYNLWAPEGSVWHQEDAAALLSPQMYQKFILPCDRKIASSFNGCFMHMHPTGFYPYKELLKTQMTAIELHLDHAGPNCQALYPVYQEIQKQKPLLIWGEIEERDLEWIFENLSPQGLAINIMLKTKKEARDIWEKYII
jgi:hypothetical protein